MRRVDDKIGLRSDAVQNRPFATDCLLQTEASVGQLRGRWHHYQGIPLRVTYHPAYLLRTPTDKGKTWEDIQEVMKVLSGEVTPSV